MATQLIQVPEGNSIQPGDEIYDGRFWRIVKSNNFKPCYVSTGQIVRRKFNPQPAECRDAFSMNE